jgi:formate hydrogenlyase subunit 3/multisubunit Na+/H+ antiporter MnhD subunit
VSDGTALATLGVPWALAVRLLAVAAALAFLGRPRWGRALAAFGSALASGISGAAALAVLATGVPAKGLLLGHGASGMAFGFTVSPLSAWFLLVLAALAIPTALYGVASAHAAPGARARPSSAGFGVCCHSRDGLRGRQRHRLLFAWGSCL